MEVIRVGETRSHGKTACLCLQQVFVMSSPAHLELCWPQVLGGWKSATSPSLSLAPLECFAFSLVLVGFTASDTMPGREEAPARRFESCFHLSWYQFVVSLIPFLSALSGTRPPSCVVL